MRNSLEMVANGAVIRVSQREQYTPAVSLLSPEPSVAVLKLFSPGIRRLAAARPWPRVDFASHAA